MSALLEATGLDAERTPQVASDAQNETRGHRPGRLRLQPRLQRDHDRGDLRGTQAHATRAGPEVEVAARHRLDCCAGGLGDVVRSHAGPVVILGERRTLHLGRELDTPPCARPSQEHPGLQVAELDCLVGGRRCSRALVQLTPRRERSVAARRGDGMHARMTGPVVPGGNALGQPLRRLRHIGYQEPVQRTDSCARRRRRAVPVGLRARRPSAHEHRRGGEGQEAWNP